ncbi:MAG: hypothetical protein V9H25_20235 [Candidatus Competibacter sp.]
MPKIELLAKSEAPTATPRPAPPAAAPAPTHPQQPASAGGGTVAGSYALQENANALRDYYRSQNVRAAVERINANGRPMYQVRIWR